MTKNPFINSLAATTYIIIVACIIFYGPKISGIDKAKDTVFAPIAMVSLFTLSAAVMGYLFLYEPAMLYLEGERKRAVNLFLKTVAVFGGTTLIIFLLLFLRIF